ncbi:MAG: ABC transporter ATP-binding protein [Rhizobiaceae bacterium]
MAAPLFELKDYSVRFATPEGEMVAVDNINLSVKPGERLAIVGESGSGKSQTFLGALRLLARNGVATGTAAFEGQNLVDMRLRDLDKIRGQDIGMVFQDPMTALNPVLRISRQLTEIVEVHKKVSNREASEQALDMLLKVGIPDPKKRFNLYPHELSGGMRQRIVIAMALLNKPKLLIADEPTTALDVTVQAQILDLFRQSTAELGAALVIITHDMGVVAGLADRVAVMYGGRIVEEASVDAIFEAPQHPYTRALLNSIPRPDRSAADMQAIPGRPPNLLRLPKGCAFSPRCAVRTDNCLEERPVLKSDATGHRVACFNANVRERELAQ